MKTKKTKVIIITPTFDHPYILQLLNSIDRAQSVGLHCAKETRLGQLFSGALEHGIPDVFHIQWHHHLLTGNTFLYSIFKTIVWFIQVVLFKLLGVRFVWTVHNVSHHEERHRRLELMGCRLLAQLVDRLVVHCPSAADTISEAYRVRKHKIVMIPHGNFGSYYDTAPAQDVCRKMLDIEHDEPLLLFFGNIRPYKGLIKLLSAFEMLDSSIPLRLLVAGKIQGDMTPELETALNAGYASRIHLKLGHLPDEQVPIVFGASDAVVLPYANVLTSGVGLLAASFGKPIIAPSIGCFRDYPSSIRIPLDATSPENLAAVLSQLTTQALKMRSKDTSEWVKQFDWPSIGEKTVALYEDIAE